MDAKPLAQTLHRLARQERNTDNVGRLILKEIRRELQTPNLSYVEVAELWRKYYPTEDIDESCGVIRVYFDGKTLTRTIRHARAPVNAEPEENPVVDGEEVFAAEKPEAYEQDFQANKPDQQNIIW